MKACTPDFFQSYYNSLYLSSKISSDPWPMANAPSLIGAFTIHILSVIVRMPFQTIEESHLNKNFLDFLDISVLSNLIPSSSSVDNLAHHKSKTSSKLVFLIT